MEFQYTQCPNCGVKMHPRGFDTHLQNYCSKKPPATQVQCPFHIYGCAEKCAQERAAEHEKLAWKRHIQLLGDFAQSTVPPKSIPAADMEALKQSISKLPYLLTPSSDYVQENPQGEVEMKLQEAFSAGHVDGHNSRGQVRGKKASSTVNRVSADIRSKSSEKIITETVSPLKSGSIKKRKLDAPAQDEPLTSQILGLSKKKSKDLDPNLKRKSGDASAQQKSDQTVLSFDPMYKFQKLEPELELLKCTIVYLENAIPWSAVYGTWMRERSAWEAKVKSAKSKSTLKELILILISYMVDSTIDRVKIERSTDLDAADLLMVIDKAIVWPEVNPDWIKKNMRDNFLADLEDSKKSAAAGV